jgi:exonuclease III
MEDDYFRPRPDVRYFNTFSRCRLVSDYEFNVLYFNARSIRNKFDEVTALLGSFKYKIDVVVIVETWLSEYECQSFNFKDYSSYHTCREQKGGAGAAVYVHKSLLSVFSESVHDIRDEVGSLIVVGLPRVGVHIMACYRPPGQLRTDEQMFLEKFEHLLSKYSKTLVLGDFNINTLLTDDSLVTDYLERLYSHGFTLLNSDDSDMATRISNTVPRTLDHALTDIVDSSYNFYIEDHALFDHKMIFLSVDIVKNVEPEYSRSKTVLDYDNCLGSEFLSVLNRVEDFEELTTNVKETIRLNTREIPVPNFSSRYRCPWMTREISQLMHVRDKYHKLKARFPNDTYVLLKFKYFRNRVTYMIRQSKASFTSSRLMRNIGNARKLWGVLKEVIFHKFSNGHANIVLSLDNGQLLTDSKAICNKFNDYFTNVAAQICQQGLDYETTVDTNYMSTLTRPSFVIEPTSGLEISGIINGLKTESASGCDLISTRFCKRAVLFLSEAISRLINNCLSANIFPSCLKLARVIPILKSGSQLVLNNYRPISILNIFSKIFEYVLLNRLQGYLNSHKVINANQYGFVHSSNTLLATTNLMSFIREKLDAGLFVVGLFIDLRKAFDCVDHGLLLSKMFRDGVRGDPLSLFKSYLEGRLQIVQVNGDESEPEVVKMGVVQGGVLSPTLFNIFVNDMFDLELNGIIQMYADDTVIKYSASSLDELFRMINEDMTRLQNWLDTNMLALNVEKTNFILFERRSPICLSDNHVVRFGNGIVKRVDSVKYLGLHLDTKLSFSGHIRHVRKKILPIMFALRRSRHLITYNTAMSIYYAYVFSQLSYLNPIWNVATGALINVLGVLQNRVLKIIKCKPLRFPTVSLYDLSVIPLKVISQYELLLWLYKIVNNKVCHNFQLVRVVEIHRYPTRTNSDFVISSFRTNWGRNCILVDGLTKFNNLPDFLRQMETISRFKTALRQFLFQEYLDGAL